MQSALQVPRALQSANELGGGIVICGYRFVDMMYTELHEYLPDQFEMLLVASPANCGERDLENIVSSVDTAEGSRITADC